MADTKTPVEKANERFESEMHLMTLRATDPKFRALTQKAAILRAGDVHAAKMDDFQSGRALASAIATFEVRAGVADYAASKGRVQNGDKVPAPILAGDTGPTTDKAPQSKAQNAKA